MNKVQGGTPKTENSLCLSCQHGMVIEGSNLEREIYCKQFWEQPKPMLYCVSRCSDYQHRNQPSLNNMYDIAWLVKSKPRGPVGFADGAEDEIKIEPPTPRTDGGPQR